MRVCKKCNKEKPLNQFVRNKNCKFDREYTCKACAKIRHREWFVLNKDRERERKKKWRHNNRDTVKARRKKYYRENNEKCKNINKSYRNNNKEKICAHRKLNNALTRGDVARPAYCGRCYKECVPEGHHEDYNKPLKVEWLCRTCHVQTHGEYVHA